MKMRLTERHLLVQTIVRIIRSTLALVTAQCMINLGLSTDQDLSIQVRKVVQDQVHSLKPTFRIHHLISRFKIDLQSMIELQPQICKALKVAKS